MQPVEGYQEVPLGMIGVNPLNPRTVFEGPSFDELVESIRQKGVLTPVLVRPMKPGPKLEDMEKSPTHGRMVDYQLVYGERRFRAACRVAAENGGIEGARIPAMVRALSDDDAFDAMVIENLQREDLNPLDEARQFKAYLDRRGEESVVKLAERIGKHPRYIRRRVAVLGLPESVLEAWGNGDLLYGHLEQFLRLEDSAAIIEAAREAADYGYSVADVKRDIDQTSPPLSQALFDLEASACLSCLRNTEVQGELFGECAATEKAKCLDPKCFKQKQNNWLNAHWDETAAAKKFKTNGFRFFDAVPYTDRESFSGRTPKACKECPSFVSLITLDGTAQDYAGRMCAGDKACFKRHTAKKGPETGDGSAPAPGTEGGASPEPRIAWHGPHYLQRFYDREMTERLASQPPAGAPVLRATLLVLVTHNYHKVAPWFVARHPEIAAENIRTWDDQPLPDKDKLCNLLASMDETTLALEIKDITGQHLLGGEVDDWDRRFLAEHLGARLETHFVVEEEYLQKKTKAELLAMGEELAVFEEPESKAYRTEVLNKKIGGKWDQLKKPELVDVFLKSGVDLTGRVPAEIKGSHHDQDH